MKKQEPNNQEEQHLIDEIVLRFQAGSEEAGEELLQLYGGHPEQTHLSLYLGKYYKILRFGKFDFKDYDSRVFIGCFFGKEERRAIIQSYQYRETKQAVVRKVAQIVEALKILDDEDLKQDLRLLFMKQARQYKKKNRTFGGYLANSYRYAVANYIIRMMKTEEPYVKLTKDLVSIANDRVRDEESEVDIQDSLLLSTPMLQTEDELDNSWVRGLSCGEEFLDLTPLQRLILKLKHYDGWSDGRIAEKMGIHINTIFRQRKKAGIIVQQTVERLKREGYDQ